jgi:hypothetical protein
MHNKRAPVIHPDIALLVDPLFAARKEGRKKVLIKTPLPLAEERVVQRSAGRVSSYAICLICLVPADAIAKCPL